MSDDHGLFEHAERTTPRIEHGYCTDDNARLLVVACREPDVGLQHQLVRRSLAFVVDAQARDGRVRNRMRADGRWTDRPTTNDCWGRSIWGLGVAATHHVDPVVAERARQSFDHAIQRRSRWPRAMAFAALGAVDVLGVDPGDKPSRAFLIDALAAIGTIRAGTWSWPEPRLRYANAALAEAVIAAGAAIDDIAAIDRGLTMLAWLLALETPRGHLSVVGVGGRGPREEGPQFDQQPIEVAAMADACWRAFVVTGDRTWSRGVATAAGWFMGDNDAGVPMYDAASGGGFDGLRSDGVNLNQGAESTLAFMSTMQRARSFAGRL